MWRPFEVKGVSSHAGNHHKDGINAIEEIAHQIIRLHQSTDYSKGTTVNVGKISGGTRTNVVPEEAEVEVDLRMTTLAEAVRMDAYIHDAHSVVPGTSIEVTGGLNRPPMERTKGNVELFNVAKNIAAELGFEVDEAAVGGGSDGNFISAMGIPVLDGLGAVGDGPHAENEHILIDKMPERAALLAQLLLEICHGE